MPQPQKKQPRREYSAESEDGTTTTIEVGLLGSINNKLAILELLQDVQDFKTSLEFSLSQIESLQKANNELHTKISEITTTIKCLSNENKLLK